MNYELVTEICLVAGIGFALLAGVLFFAFEVPDLVKGMRSRVRRGKTRETVRELQVPGEAYAGAEETVRMDDEEILGSGEDDLPESVRLDGEKKIAGQADDVKAEPSGYGDVRQGRRDET